MAQIYNPYLPSYEYIPDGEPHVFGDRVYVYGSHDRFGGDKFCMNHYVCYSAPVDELTNWKYEGVIYRNDQDPRMQDGKSQLWAPDVVKGKDGRYYLYYCPDDKHVNIGVAVADEPAGKYEYYGLVSDKTGQPIGSRPNDTIQFDPGVFIDDDGEIYLYSGNGPRTRRDIGKEPKNSVVMKLEDDMLTIKTEPRKLMPLLGEADDTPYAGHEFFEASSIRKINGKYYFVYSSVKLHELCYAVSDRPDSGYCFGGVLVSNADIIKSQNRNDPKNCYGNNHGGIELINGQWYIFYHRQTNRSHYSRQGCAEKLELSPDGHFAQVEMTSCGLNHGPLEGSGEYPANIACNIYGRHKPTISHPLAMRKLHPYLTQDGSDYDPDTDKDMTPPVQYIANCKNGFTALYRYFELQNLKKISITVRGKAKGVITVSDDAGSSEIAKINISSSSEWKKFVADASSRAGITALCFHFAGNGSFDFLKFELK
jgi:hypothetical protein